MSTKKEVESLVSQVRDLNVTHTNLVVTMTDFKLATSTLWSSSNSQLKKVNETLKTHETALEKLRMCIEMLNTLVSEVVTSVRAQNEEYARSIQSIIQDQRNYIEHKLGDMECRLNCMDQRAYHPPTPLLLNRSPLVQSPLALSMSPLDLSELEKDMDFDLMCREVMDSDIYFPACDI
jgi:hypothetical protein